MHNSYKNEVIIKVYSKGTIVSEIKSRKYVWGFEMPWTNQRGDTLYNYNIETKLNNIIAIKDKINKPLNRLKLQKYLVNKIIDSYMPSLYKLSAFSYQKEIDELNTDFRIISFEEFRERGRYIWNEPATMKIVLKNQLMLNNVNLVFLASKNRKSIYSRDSIKKEYFEYVNRIQSIEFISDYLKSNPSARLDIYYFNNRGINDYNIENINKSPREWKLHDAYLKNLETSKKLGVKFSFDIDKSIKISQQVYCGCNYRFDKSYVEKAIFFEIHDANNNSSIWFLLPDNKVLLYLMNDTIALNFKRSDFNDTKEYGLIYPCAIFDSNGDKMQK